MVELPYIALVWADLCGNPAEELLPVEQRKAKNIDADHFDEVLKGYKPRVNFLVDNKLTGDGQIPVDITFEKMTDFEPGALAKKVEPLRKLLEAREQLSSMLGLIGGKRDLEQMMEKLRNTPDLLKTLSEELEKSSEAAPQEGEEKSDESAKEEAPKQE